jgi:hypothetical protein
MVGRSGNSGERRAPVTPSARTLLSCTSPTAGGSGLNIMST